MKNKDDLRNELNEISPFLNEMKGKGEGFEVPKNYFQNLTEEVLSGIEFEKPSVTESPKSKQNWLDDLINSIQWIFQPKPVLAFASVAVLLMAGYFLIDNSEIGNPSIAEISIDEISTEELQEYLFSNIDEFETDLLTANNEQIIQDLESNSNYEETLDEVLEDMELEDLEELL